MTACELLVLVRRSEACGLKPAAIAMNKWSLDFLMSHLGAYRWYKSEYPAFSFCGIPILLFDDPAQMEYVRILYSPCEAA